MKLITKHEARIEAKEESTPINKLIRPEDINSECESWNEIPEEELEMELCKCADVILSENQQPFAGLVEDLAYTLWQDHLPRIRMKNLVFEDMDEAVRNEIWPFKMNKWECMEVLQEMEPPSDCYNEAYETIFAGIVEGMHPEEE